MALIVERLLAARFCRAIARFIHTECFLPHGAELGARMAAGQFEAMGSQPTNKSVFLVSAKGHVQIMRWLALRHSLDWHQVLNGASYGGRLRFLYLATHNGVTNFDEALFEACRGGHRNVAEWIMSKGANFFWNWALCGACEGGHRELAELMISKGADGFHLGLAAACACGHRELAELMIAKGAKNFNRGLRGACGDGHRELVELMISKGADDWSLGLRAACIGGHRELAELMISNGAKSL
jgi:hypothetical protein